MKIRLLSFSFLWLVFSSPSLSSDYDSLSLILEAPVDNELKIERLLNNAVALQRRDPVLAIEFASEAYKLSQEAGNDLLKVRSAINWGFAHQLKGNYDSAIICYELADSIAIKISYYKGRAGALNSLAGIFDSQGLYDKALENALQALYLVEEHFEEKATLKPLVNIGVIYSNLKEERKALAFYKKALLISKKYDIQSSTIILYHNIGDIYFKLNLYDSALINLNVARKLEIAADDQHTLAQTLASIGLVYLETGQYSLAINHYHQALQIKNNFDDVYGQTSVLSYLGELHLLQKSYDSAVWYFQNSLHLAKEGRFYDHQRFIFEKLSELHAATGNYEAAYKNLQDFIVAKDTMMNEEKVRQLNELQTQYETEQKEKQIALQNARLQQQNSNTRLLLIGVVVIILLFLLYFQWYKQKQKLKLIEAEKIKELDKVKSDFFANISHEFRTPLTLIIGSLSKLLSNKQLSIDQLTSEYNIMRNNSGRLLQLINQLLELSMLDEGKSRIRTRKTDFILFIRRILMTFASYAQQKHLTVLFNGIDIQVVELNMSLSVYIDQDKMEKVFYNLFSNAIKFTPVYGKIEVRIEINEAGKDVDVLVINSGPGIPKDKIGRIFERFYQLDNQNTRKHEGTGIGLSLVKELVELHHGTVWVESIEGETTTFVISIPLGKDHLQREEIISDKNEMNISPSFEVTGVSDYSEQTLVDIEEDLNQEIVLIVEDHAELRKYIKECLSSQFRILEADNGNSGFSLASEHIPDLIISDLMMPEADGYEFLQNVRENEKTSHIPFVLLTARATVKDKLTGLEMGADDYLIKPFQPEELKIKVANLIKIRNQLREKFGRELHLKPANIKVPSQQEKFLQQVMLHLEQKLADPLFGVEQLSDELGMSRAQAHRKLKAITNLAPSELIRQYRLQKAADLIQQDAGNMAEIAYQVGFSSQAHFTRTFQEHYHCSPSEFKKRMQLEN